MTLAAEHYAKKEMKRDKNLQALSRDHHHGLLLGWKIRQGLKHNVNAGLIAEYILYFSEAALFPHFAEEEQQILIFLNDDNDLKLKTLDDHREIAAMIKSINIDSDDSENFLKIASRLDDHIRFEERELFPYLQEVLSADQLNLIGAAIDDLHQPFIDNFHTEFWNIPKN